jgi:PAS domain S-box-containing protein
MSPQKKPVSRKSSQSKPSPRDRLARLNRTYALLSAINRTIVHVREPQMLFELACRIAVENGGFRMAWIGFIDPETGFVKPIASAGEVDGFLEKILPHEGRETEVGPSAVALQTGAYKVVNDIASDPLIAPWREDALRLGYRSTVSFPLIVSGWKPGTINLYASEKDCFDQEELELLDEMVHDIVFALEFIGQEEQRRRAEQMLLESERRYQTLARISPVGIFRANLDGSTTYVNPQWCAISGMSAEHALGYGWLEAVHPEDRDRIVQGWQESTQSQRASYSDYRFIRPDGAVAWVMGQAVPEADIDGQIIGYIGTITDITERKQFEATLQSNERLLSLIYANISDILFFLAVEPGDHYRFISVNPVFLKVTGLSEGQVLGKPMEEVIPKPTQSLVRRNYRKAILSKKSVGWEDVSDYPAGKKYGEVNVSPVLDANGNCTHLIGTVHDITDRKLAEAEIHQLNAELEERVRQRTAQLETANKELESFSYSVSHDLRAPLRAISGFSEIISRRHRDSLNEEGRHYIDNIIQASQRMGELIDDLLTYSRLGRAGVRREPVSLAGLLGEIARNLQPRLEEVHGRLDFPQDLPSLASDRTLLSQIFMNLVDNGLKYHQPKVPPQVSLAYYEEGKDIIVSVSDNGIGIPTEYQEKIFNVFQRLHSEEEYPGTGIGLASVRKSVELLGGSVWVQSKPGLGSTFFVRLPKE